MTQAESERVEMGQPTALVAFATEEEAARHSLGSRGRVLVLSTRGADVHVGKHIPEQYVLAAPPPEEGIAVPVAEEPIAPKRPTELHSIRDPWEKL